MNEFGKPQEFGEFGATGDKPEEFGEFGATSDDDVEAHLFEKPEVTSE
jgi:hypothetical protein